MNEKPTEKQMAFLLKNLSRGELADVIEKYVSKDEVREVISKWIQDDNERRVQHLMRARQTSRETASWYGKMKQEVEEMMYGHTNGSYDRGFMIDGVLYVYGEPDVGEGPGFGKPKTVYLDEREM